jgi:DNA-binding CsgD family transcriptional regulator
MKTLVKVIFVLFFIFQSPVLISQFVGKPFVINYDKRTYGGDNQNWSVAVGKNGLTYFGNDKGLLEFDGSNWSLYPMPHNGIVRSVTVGDDNNIYVGSYQEFGFWRRDQHGLLKYVSLSDRFLPQNSLHNDEIWRIVAHDGKIYFQSFSNIFIYDGRQVSILDPDSSMVLLVKANGRLFIHLVGKGLFEIIEDAFRIIPGSEIFAGDEIKVMLPYEGNRFLLGVSGRGMFVFDGSVFSVWDNPVNSLLASSELNNGISGNNHLVIGTIGNGLFILDDNGNLQEHLNSRNFLQNNTILALAFDPAGNIWAGLDRGIDLINLHSGMDYYVDPTGTMGSVYAAVLDGTDLLVGTNQGLYRYNFVSGEGYVNSGLIDGMNGQVWDLKNIDGEVLCGHTNGTYRILGNHATKISNINGGFEIRRIPDRTKDFLLQSTYSAFAVYKALNSNWVLDHSVDGFYEPINYYESDHLGNIWCSHATRGVFRVRLKSDLSFVESVKMYGEERGLPSDRHINVVKIENRIVFPTGSQLFTWDDLNDTVIPFTQLNEKIVDFINSRHVIKSRENHYWFIKNHDIALFRITDFSVDLVFRYDFFMQGLYLNSRYPKIISLKEGLHLICLDEGFAIFDEIGLRTLAPPAPVFFRKVLAKSRSGKVMPLPIDSARRTFRIPNGFRSLNFEFSAGTGYRHPLYRSKLDGLERFWGPWMDQSSLSFTRLPIGEYKMNISSMNINGLPGPPAIFSFAIKPPWFRSILAYCIYCALIVGSFVFFRILFLKRLRLHKQRIEEEEIEKRRLEILAAEQEVIRLRNEKLEAEVNFKNIQLADFTMSIIKRNEQLIRIRDEFAKHSPDRGSSYSRIFHEKIIRLFDKQLSSEDDWQTFETHFDQAHQDFINRLKANYPNLTQSDLKLCAYLRLNISSKEIAHLLNISLRGVEVRRYRLRKRLNISTEENLYDFLLRF